MTERYSYDVVIVGGGAAGLRAAIAAASHSDKLSVAVISKVYPMRSHTVSAEGGTASVLKEYDSFELHASDTIKGGDYLADQDAVEAFVKEAPSEIIQLEHWGCPWSREPDGKLAVRAFGGMSVKRTVFAADKTGFHMLHTLFQHSLRYPNIIRLDEWFVSSLIMEDGMVKGLVALDLRTRELAFIASRAVIMATGGAGRIFQFTTNAVIKTGDGMAMAYRAGAPLKDMEFIQFHPTALPGSGILITEASRGEGGYLINKDQERFLKRYTPEKMELGPRDILSRALITEIREGRGYEGPFGSYVLLDLRHLGEELIDRKLPFVRELARNYAGIDPVHEPIPVRPAVHYTMGGIHTDVLGRTPVAGLYACGEAACVSINGANRLGSNSLSECLVFGRAAGVDAATFALSKKGQGEIEDSNLLNPVGEYLRIDEEKIYGLLKREGGGERLSDLRSHLQSIMDTNVGIFRDSSGLQEARRQIRELRTGLQRAAIDDKGTVYNTEVIEAFELGFMLDVADAIAYSALIREESRGAHYRTDFPKRDDKNFLFHQLSYYSPGGPVIKHLSVSITKWQPAERKY
ncbi:MAG: succinate dehydrogenase/fumarate reductase flavoprotein subunit [Thaumarchaeota archaeon]|nr:succinate dehydrogenase/fumarate reductase flavoprotein subunit [Nitrososphaerota archaeon]MBI3115722.1 succinate dehydrogenase/fumarate reductase flavoprotein subunit [Nitrososphaerota archaeon]